MTIGERILELIHDNHMTQKTFSERTGIPQSTISSWKGKKQNPSADKLQIICDVLKVDLYYLLSGAESNEKYKTDYTVVYHIDQEYELLIEFRRLDQNRRNRLMGYLRALKEEKGKTAMKSVGNSAGTELQ